MVLHFSEPGWLVDFQKKSPEELALGKIFGGHFEFSPYEWSGNKGESYEI